MDTPTHTFSVSEVFKDGRVLVATYTHVGESINMVMDVYDDATMRNGKRYLDLHLEQSIPTLVGQAENE